MTLKCCQELFGVNLPKAKVVPAPLPSVSFSVATVSAVFVPLNLKPSGVNVPLAITPARWDARS